MVQSEKMEAWPKTADIVIIGGGIMGISAAYFLVKSAKVKVVLLEKSLLAQASTGLGVGGIRQQFSHSANILLSQETLKLIKHFKEEFESDIDFHQVGYLFLAQREETWRSFLESVKLQRRYQVPVELLSPNNIKKRWPYLETDDLKGGTFCPKDGHVDPYEVAMSLATACRKKGVRIFQETEALNVLVQRDRVQGVQTSKGHISAPIVVNSAGPWGGEVAKMAGLKVPVKPFRRQVFVTRAFKTIAGKIPMIIDQDTLFYFRKEGSGILMGMSDLEEPPSFDTHVDQNFLEKLTETAIQRAPILEEAKILRGWGGLYAITPDENPIIGEIENINGFFCAIGFSGHGFQHGPAVGRILSELILNGKTDFDLSPFAFSRFDEPASKGEERTV